MRRLLSSVEYNDTPTRAENDKQLEARLSQRMRDTKPTAIATARLADESGRRTPGGRPIARDPVGRRRCSPHLCRTHARDKPLTHQTKHPATERKPHPPHICGCGAQKQQTNTTQQTTNKHTTIATHPTARSSQPLPSLNPQSHAAYHAAIKEDATRRPQKKHTRNTYHSAKHAKPPRTCTHDRHKPKRTSTSPSSPHAQARSLDRRGARKQARPRRAQRTRTQPRAATQTPRNTMSAERKTREDAAHLPPFPSSSSRGSSSTRISRSRSRSLSLSLSSALTPRASRRSPLAGGNRHACNHATRQAARTAAAQRETVPRSRRRVPTPAALGARA